MYSTMISIRKIFPLLVLAAAFSGILSCLQLEEDDSGALTTSVTLDLGIKAIEGEEETATKTSITADTSALKNFNLWVYGPDGNLKATGYNKYYDLTNSAAKNDTSRNAILGGLVIGAEYQVRVLANVGQVTTPPTTLTACDASTQAWNIADFNSRGAVPMSCKTSFIAQVSNPKVHVKLVRLFAKYTFIIDQTDFSHGGFTVTSLKLKNAPSKCKPFDDSKTDGSTITSVDGDYATSDDLTGLTQGSSKTFYLYENKQGDVLSGNTNSWQKEFDNYNTSKKATYADKCSYLEVKGTYSGQGLTDEVTYKAYLGTNATSNFDVVRNTAYTVTLVLNEENALYKNGSWKVTRGTIDDQRVLSVPATLIVGAKTDTAKLNVTVSPGNLAIRKPSTDATTYSAAKLSSSPALDSFAGPKTFTLKNTEKLTQDKQTTITFRTWDWNGDSGRGKQAQCVVTVLAPRVVRVVVSPATASVPAGYTQTFTAKAYYDTGDSLVINNDAKNVWSGDTKAVYQSKSSSGAVYKGVNGGTSSVTGTVKAEFKGYVDTNVVSGTAQLTVRPKEIVSISIEPANGWSVYQTNDITFKAKAKYTDGSEAYITNSVSWTSSDNSKLEYKSKDNDKATFNGKAAGTNITVTASISNGVYGGGTASATSKGSVIGIQSLTLTPASYWSYNKTNPSTNSPQVTWTLTGKMTDGGDAPAAYLDQATWSCSSHLTLVSGHTYKFNAKSADKAAWVKVTLAGKTIESKGTVVDDVDYYDAPTGLTISCNDVPAGGGSVTSGTISGTCKQVVHYKSGDTETLTITNYTASWSGGASGVASLGTTVKARTKLDGKTLTLTYTANGKSSTATCDVYQAENKVTSQTTTDGKDEKDYTVSFGTPSSSSLEATSGSSATVKVTATHKKDTWTNYKDTYSSGAVHEYEGTHSGYSTVNDNFTVSSNQTWASVSGAGASGATVTVSTTAANTGAAREVTITAKNSSNTSTTASITFTQKAQSNIADPGGEQEETW